MISHQIQAFTNKTVFLLCFLLFIFFAKGVVFSILLPFFQGPDEQIHYGTIQYRAEPIDKDWVITKGKDTAVGNDITTYHLSEESIQGAVATQFDEVKFQSENTQEFSQSTVGINEGEIIENSWKRYIDIYPTNTSGARSFYYTLGAQIENFFSDQSILFRLFALRLFSVVLGTLVVLLTYLTARKINFSEWQSLIIASLVAFQPMFSASASQVNIDIALIFSFSLFIYAGVGLLDACLRGNNQIKYILLLIGSIILGFYSKGPGIVLAICAVPSLIFVAYQHFSYIPKKTFLWVLFFTCAFLIATIFAIVPASYIASITNGSATSQFSSPNESISRYLSKTLTNTSLRRTTESYWGNFGWLDTTVSGTIIRIIFIIENIAWFGIFFYLISETALIKKIMRGKYQMKAFVWFESKREYLPEKRFVIFFISIIIALQFAIRFYDWRVFDVQGKILIGQPGRYFLPNIIPHILLVVTGLGFFMKNKRLFSIFLKISFIIMILFSLHTIVNVIIPRYYL